MTNSQGIGGLLTALILPCDPGDGRVLYDAIPALVEHQVAMGVHGLFLLGTAGQGPLLTLDERKQVLETVFAAAASRLTIVCHAGAATTHQTLDLVEHATGVGVTAVSSVPPVYYSPDELTVDEYYEKIIAATPLPVYAYDNPSATAYTFSVAQLARLVERGLAGAKVARNDIVYLQRLVSAGVPTWTASADLNAAGYFGGASGAISTITNVAPGLFGELRYAALAGDVSRALELQARVSAVAAGVRGPIIGGLHFGASLLGLEAGAPRRPLRLPNTEEQERIREALRIEDLV